MTHHHTSQLGPGYRSNSAGDGPEKTRDRKHWFPRFKSTLAGSFRATRMFACCECAFGKSDGPHRYKASDGTHCVCGKDEWPLAKAVEVNEYNRRLALCAAHDGKRYEDIVAAGDDGALSPLPFDESSILMPDAALSDYLSEFLDDASSIDDEL
ncbi:hypothetical protein SPRG_06154 [Saprolegnia parasitica CBS 223.65]|uniref:Uncharacterized protein n=1 Tax=Saprolegnia parasitica (strain CBS 223.65) TaxID=695850 RepID=A0A067CF27_SAPPC|nr:hypothetical protein SPRG_06154 [Saprolegnia parasitica CBS 223.65]KDO29098.1 hypothetical protein SPRG_06154 [Saprolegnia parasitica CBS 223.65]|eukprot:XP_012200266.1 hypothetical protein SPRG_06154 [Saprolegnia parasitica CBS 223.65]